MKNILVPVAILSIFAFFGCNNDSSTEVQTTGPLPTTAAPLISDTNANKIQTAPVTIPPANTAQPVAATGLNPAHGQPGHRCDIAVGAPLDGKPAQSSIQTSPATTIASPLNTPSTTGKALNPAHGQPGHRCEIAVGAPLDSKPVQSNIQAPGAATTATPVTATPLNTPSSLGNGINPAHGQPGHRCDIAVGASLNSKPAQ